MYKRQVCFHLTQLIEDAGLRSPSDIRIQLNRKTFKARVNQYWGQGSKWEMWKFKSAGKAFFWVQSIANSPAAVAGDGRIRMGQMAREGCV